MHQGITYTLSCKLCILCTIIIVLVSQLHAQFIDTDYSSDSSFQCYAEYPNSTFACMGRGLCIAPDYCLCDQRLGFTGPGCSLSICRSEVHVFGVDTNLPSNPFNQILHFELSGNSPAKLNPFRDPIIFLDVGAQHAVMATRKWIFTLGTQTTYNALGRGTNGESINDYTPAQVYIQGADSETAHFTFDDRSLMSTRESIQGVCAGADYSYFWTNKRVFCTGRNDDGQCAQMASTPANIPQFTDVMPGASEMDIRSIRCGREHVLMLESNTTVWQTGRIISGGGIGPQGFFDPLHQPIEEHIALIDAGDGISLALTVTGRVFAWGITTILPGTDAAREIPQELDFQYLFAVHGNPGTVRDKIVHISCRGSYVLMTTARGEVISWGEEHYGNLAHDISRVDIPRSVPHTAAAYIVEPINEGSQAPDTTFELDKSHVHWAFAGADYSSFVLSHGFKAWAFGNGEHGLLGTNDTYGRAIPEALSVFRQNTVTFSSSGAMSMALSGKLYNGIEQCGCPGGMSGEFCDQFNCFGVNRFADDVCFSRGTCKCPDHCECDEPDKYGGIKCSPICFGSFHPSFNTCSSHGECVAPNTCVCEEGWTGIDCSEELFECYYKIGLEEACSGHGTCLESGVCDCFAGYSDQECQTTDSAEVYCFELHSLESGVCSGHGTCGSTDTCTCAGGYDGPMCEFPICFGENSNSSTVCSGHGSCDSPAKCSCDKHYDLALDCSETTCFGEDSSSGTGCSNHGSCVAYNECECDPNFFGEKCDQQTCDLDPAPCSNRGSCNTTSLSCICDDYSTTFGHYAGRNCEQCEEGYYGSNCNTTITPHFLWRDDLQHLRGVIHGADIVDESLIGCSDLFPNSTLELFGDTPECTLQNGEFIVKLGYNPKMRVVEPLRVNMLFQEASGQFTPSFQYAHILTLNPVSPPPIEFDLRVIATNNNPLEHNPCENLGLVIENVSPSYPEGGLWAFAIFFHVESNLCPVYNINQFLYTLDHNNLTPTVPYQYMFPGCDYTFRATMRSRFCQSVSKFVFVQTAHQLSTPVIDQVTNPHSLLSSANLRVSIPSMTDSCFAIFYQWTITPPLVFSAPQVDVLHIYHNDFPFKDMDYDIVVMARSKAGFSNSTARATLQVLRPPVVAGIGGGSRREVIGDGNPWTLDGTPSYDPYAARCGPTCTYTYTWDCVDYVDASRTCPFKNLLSNSPLLNLPSHITDGRTILFILNFANDGRIDTATQIVDFTRWLGAKILLVPPQYLITNYANVMRATLLSPNAISGVRWFVSNGINLDSSTVYGNPESLVITLRENVLTPGLEYIFTVSVTDQLTGLSTTSSIRLRAYQAPHSGVFSVSPSSGVEGSTVFAMSAMGWIGDHSPLEYQFGYEYEYGIRVPLNDFSTQATFESILTVVGDVKFYVIVRDPVTKATTLTTSPFIKVEIDQNSPGGANNTSPEVVFENAKNLTDATEELINSGSMEDALLLLLAAVRALNNRIPNVKFPLQENICSLCQADNTIICVANKCACAERFNGDLCTVSQEHWQTELDLRQRFYSILQSIIVAPSCSRLTVKLIILEGILRNRQTVNTILISDVVEYATDLLLEHPLCSLTDMQLLVDVASNAYNGILSVRARHPLSELLDATEVAYIERINDMIYQNLHRGMDQISEQENLLTLQLDSAFSADWVHAALSKRLIVDFEAEPSSSRKRTLSFSDLVVRPTELGFSKEYTDDHVISFQSSSWDVDVLALQSRNASYHVDNQPILQSNVASMRLVDVVSLNFTKTTNSTVLYKMRGDFSGEGAFVCHSIDNVAAWNPSQACRFVAESPTIAYCECDYNTDMFIDRVGVFYTRMHAPAPPIDPSSAQWLIFLLSGLGIVFCCCSMLICFIVLATMLVYGVLVMCSLARVSRKRATIASDPDFSTDGSVLEDDFDSLHHTKEMDTHQSATWSQSLSSSKDSLDEEAPRGRRKLKSNPSWDSTHGGTLTHQHSSGYTLDSGMTSGQHSAHSQPQTTSSQSFGAFMEPSSQGFTNLEEIGSFDPLPQTNLSSSTLTLGDIPLRANSGSTIMHMPSSSTLEGGVFPTSSTMNDIGELTLSEQPFSRSTSLAEGQLPKLRSALKSKEHLTDESAKYRHSVRFSSLESLPSEQVQVQHAQLKQVASEEFVGRRSATLRRNRSILPVDGDL